MQRDVCVCLREAGTINYFSRDRGSGGLVVSVFANFSVELLDGLLGYLEVV